MISRRRRWAPGWLLGLALMVGAVGLAGGSGKPSQPDRETRPIDPETGEFVRAPADRDDLDMQLPVEYQPEPELPPPAAPEPAAPTVVLYNNGPFVNCAGCGVLGADESVLQNSSLGMTTIGFGHQISADNWIADDFIVTDPAGWTVTGIRTYAYQTGSTATSTLDDLRLRIWDGPPGQAGSSMVFGSTVNRLESSAWTGVYRVSEMTSGTATNRPIMRTLAPVNVYLPPGTYWLDWQVGGTLGSGPWAPPITQNGQTTTGNGLRSADGGVSYAPANDTGTGARQGFPFLLLGQVGNAGPIADVLLHKTAGLDPGACATTDRIKVAHGSTVTYCYQVGNVGNVSFGLHDLVDNKLGTILDDFSFTFVPDTSVFLTQSAVLDATTLNTATWTSFNAGPTDVAASTDQATVIVSPPEPLVCNGPVVDFDLGIPSDWAVVNNAPGNPVVWSNLGGCGEAGNYTGGSGDAACASSDLQGGGSGLYDTELVSPPFSLAGVAQASLAYRANYQNFGLVDFLDVDISVDGGASWTPVLSWNEDHGVLRAGPGELVSIDLSPWAGLAGLRLRWHYYDPAGPDTADDWYAQIDNVALGCDQSTTVDYCSTPGLAIPDDTPAGVQDVISVTDSRILSDLDVTIKADHTWVGDLIFTLEHVATGTAVTLVDRPGVPATTFGCPGNDIDAVIDDEAATGVESECGAGTPTILGSFIGGDPADSTLLAAFDGEGLAGNWRLTVSDNAGGDTGTLLDWCLGGSASAPVPGCTGLTIADKTYGTEVLEACDWITYGPNVKVGAGGTLDATSGTGHRLDNDVELGGRVTLAIDPSLGPP